jgi:hypothetical protein
MTHLSEDQLLALALDIASPEEKQGRRSHLASCASCSDQLRLIERDIEVISSLTPDLHVIPSPQRKRTTQFASVLRAAATLLVGVAIGSIATARLMTEPPPVRASNLIRSATQEALHHWPTPDATAAF